MNHLDILMMYSFHMLVLVDCIMASWNKCKNNIFEMDWNGCFLLRNPVNFAYKSV